VSRAFQRARTGFIPAGVLLTVTHRCQLACAHCYQAEHEGDGLSTAALVALLDELQLLGTLDLTFTGGEALLRKDLFTLIEEARRRAFAVTLFSNGGPITREVAQRLRELRVMRVELSLHGSHAATHDGFTGREGAFARAVRAIEHLDDAGVPVLVKSNVVRSNAAEIERLQGLFAARPRVRFMSDVLLHARDDGASTLSQRATSGQIADHFGWKARAASDEELGLLARQLASAPPESAYAAREPCGAGRSYAVVMPDGAVLACTHLASHPLGRLGEKSFSEIWLSSPQLAALRAVTLERFAECRGCRFRHVCAKCPALSQSEAGRLDGHSQQICDRTKAYWGAIERERAHRQGGLPRLTPPPLQAPPEEQAGPRAGLKALRVLHEGTAFEGGCP
jgi:radical SAM protein with 4Fe4S-binding SPASM domain